MGCRGLPRPLTRASSTALNGLPLEIKSYTQVAFVMPRFPISLKYRKCFGLPMGQVGWEPEAVRLVACQQDRGKAGPVQSGTSDSPP